MISIIATLFMIQSANATSGNPFEGESFQWIFVFICGLLAGLAPPVAGFGCAMVFQTFWFVFTQLGVMDQTEKLAHAVTILNLVLICAQSSAFVSKYEHVRWRMVLFMGIGAGLFTYFGVLIVDEFGSSVWVKRGMGFIFLVVLMLQQLKAYISSPCPQSFNQLSKTQWAALSVAITVSGVLAGLAGVGGPPMIVFVLFANIEKTSFVGSYNGSVIIRSIFSSIFLVLKGQYDSQFGWLYASAIVAGLIGSFVGRALSSKVDQSVFRKILQLILLLAGVNMCLAKTSFGRYITISVIVILIAYALYKRFSPKNDMVTEKLLDRIECTDLSKPVRFFMVGSQRSGSNWLRTLINQSDFIAAPHPPHILKHFMPLLSQYGDLTVQDNFDLLLEHVCTYVESNTVPWTDNNDQEIKFDRDQVSQRCEKQSLVAIFAVIMDIFTESNDKTTWICKSMGNARYSKEIEAHFGVNGVGFVFLHRDPRDVACSFMKAPVGNKHYYTIANAWHSLQQQAFEIIDDNRYRIYRISYEDMLEDTDAEIDSLFAWIGSPPPVIGGAKMSKESKKAAERSELWKNLTRGASLKDGQKNKWLKSGKLTSEDLSIIESICSDSMERLGYAESTVHLGHLKDLLEETSQVLTTIQREFTQDEIEEFERLNKEGIQKRWERLAQEDPDDYERRMLLKNRLKQFKHVLEHRGKFNTLYIPVTSDDLGLSSCSEEEVSVNSMASHSI